MPRTYATKPNGAVRYWRRHRQRPVYVSTLEAVSRRAQYLLAETPRCFGGRVILGDSTRVLRRLRARRFKWIVTSPPYPGMRSYRPDQWLRYWFLGGDGSVPYGNDGQLGCHTGEAFILRLGEVWSSVARLSVPGARLYVRFGTLPSVAGDPVSALRDSFLFSGGWRVTSIIEAATSPAGRRQADQFGRDLGAAITEVDLSAVLEV